MNKLKNKKPLEDSITVNKPQIPNKPIKIEETQREEEKKIYNNRNNMRPKAGITKSGRRSMEYGGKITYGK